MLLYSTFLKSYNSFVCYINVGMSPLNLPELVKSGSSSWLGEVDLNIVHGSISHIFSVILIYRLDIFRVSNSGENVFVYTVVLLVF